MSVSSPLMPVRCASPATPSHSRCSSRSSLTSVKAAQSWRIVSSDSDASERAGMPGFDEWESFYVIVGAAAGALIGLQFVVMTLLADKPQLASPEAGAAFATPNVVHFSAALLLSALMRVPWHSLASAAEAWGLVGLAGVVYVVIVIRRMRSQRTYQPDWEDWTYHVMLPLLTYALLLGSALAAKSHEEDALIGVAAAALLQLFIGIHNSWDTIVYHVLVRMRNAKD